MSLLISNLKCHLERIASRRSSLQKITVKDFLYGSQFHLKQSKIPFRRLLTLLEMTGECGHEVKKQKKGAKAPKDLIETTA